MKWKDQLLEQLTFHWDMQIRPRLDGLTDEEYLWEPAPGSWSIRPSEDGTVFPDWEFPEPNPPPVTTIAWRMSHVACGCFAMRTSSHFGDGSVGCENFSYAGTAAEGIASLEKHYAEWVSHIRGMDEEALWRPVGPAEGTWAEHPFVGLVLHINREVIHHMAEVSLLRDLFRARQGAQVSA